MALKKLSECLYKQNWKLTWPEKKLERYTRRQSDLDAQMDYEMEKWRMKVRMPPGAFSHEHACRKNRECPESTMTFSLPHVINLGQIIETEAGTALLSED